MKHILLWIPIIGLIYWFFYLSNELESDPVLNYKSNIVIIWIHMHIYSIVIPIIILFVLYITKSLGAELYCYP